MNAAFGFPGYVLLSILQFMYPFIGTLACYAFNQLLIQHFFRNPTAMVSYNVIVGDTITKVLVFYAGIGPESIWAQRELIIGLTYVS